MSEKLKTHIERRLQTTMARYGNEVQKVRVQLSDINGPRGGDDIQCHIQTYFSRGGTFVIKETRDNPFTAVASATTRAGRSLSRQIDRIRTRRKGR